MDRNYCKEEIKKSLFDLVSKVLILVFKEMNCMEQNELIYDYKDMENYRLSFNHLANLVFGIDFEKWYQKGCWNDRYICYSYIDGDKVISNVSISKMDVLLNGEKRKGLQIGTVMTHPEYRNRGLAASLMDKVLNEYEDKYDFIYLFANPSVLNFYPKFGFKAFNEHQFSLDVNITNPCGGHIRKLDASNADDFNIIRRLAYERIPTSTAFDVQNAQHILFWYCFNIFHNNMFYSEEDDMIVIFEQKESKLHLYDIMSKKEICFSRVLDRIASDEAKEVLFYFTPNFKDINARCTYVQREDTLFIRTATIKMPDNFIYPITAHA